MLNWGIKDETGEMFIRLDPDGAPLFDNLAYIGWEERLSLPSNMAKALQLYVSGHQQGKPHSQPIENIMAWCGYGGRLRRFRAALPKALEELEEAGVITEGKVIKGKEAVIVTVYHGYGNNWDKGAFYDWDKRALFFPNWDKRAFDWDKREALNWDKRAFDWDKRAFDWDKRAQRRRRARNGMALSIPKHGTWNMFLTWNMLFTPLRGG